MVSENEELVLSAIIDGARSKLSSDADFSLYQASTLARR